MLAMDYRGPYRIRVTEKPMPEILHPRDAIVRVTRSCICGSDLHLYHGMVPDTRVGMTFGHEFCGIVEEVGAEVKTVRAGQFVVGSFFASDNTCAVCQAGYQTSCLHRQGVSGAQGEYMRVPLADGTLVTPVP